ncbi:RES domain-containing protein [uncultured Tateyamaria sp.]|uniref:RES domain-containing protein n=1 Tax=uncultured Tateyamaria sp. TaxID=455651 RepID=UPI00262F3512|nr:RES domain-containing protein [uncultured Tateyamaria sp.]
MRSGKTTDELRENQVCHECIGEVYLAGLVEAEGRRRKCSYCKDGSQTVTLDALSDHIERAFEQHFERTTRDPDGMQWAMMKDKELDYDWEREGELAVWAIAGAAEVDEDIATDLQIVLNDRHADMEAAMIGEETEFDDEVHYEQILPSSREWHERWYEFERTLKEESRFFSRTCQDQLEAIFAGIDHMQTLSGVSVIETLDPDDDGAVLHRARVFYRDEELEEALKRPDLLLAPPPSAVASAGRMNAKGVSVFYGASSINGSLAEVRPPVGSKVVIGEFRPIRPLRLLNLSALQGVSIQGSIFDPSYSDALARMGFIRTLSNRMSRPVMPTDVDFDHLPTQAVSDFLANHRDYNLDGVRFSSVQTGGESDNIVLFHKAARVQPIDLPKGTKLDARSYWETEDGAEPDYSVTERVPKQDKEGNTKRGETSPFDLMSLRWGETDHDYREESLAVDARTLSVHWINATQFDTTTFDVDRDRYEMPTRSHVTTGPDDF